MNDLPTRLRTEAAEHYRSGSKLWLCGIPEGSEMQARALLMRDAADEIERMHQAIKTEANDTREMAESIGSLEAKACLEAVADNLDAARWAWLASSPIVKTEDGA